ncbi:MAG: phosphatase PAP2 family protein [Candidatus Nomurabacteria bacterium]
MNQIIFFCGTYLIYVSIVFTVLYLFFKGDKKHLIRNLIVLLGGATLSWIAAHFLKDIIAHPRPDLTLALLEPNDIYSFPSGHASFMFALGFLMSYLNKRAGIIILILALVTGIARVLAGVHYWYDILGGAVLAYFVSYLIFFVYKKYFHEN